MDLITSNNPETNATEMTVYAHLDHIGGTGDHTGYSVYALKSGEKLWVKFQGTHYLAPKGDAWEIPYQGVMHLIAGTGKYKNIRGGGHYVGSVTPTSHTEEIVCVGEY